MEQHCQHCQLGEFYSLTIITGMKNSKMIWDKNNPMAALLAQNIAVLFGFVNTPEEFQAIQSGHDLIEPAMRERVHSREAAMVLISGVANLLPRLPEILSKCAVAEPQWRLRSFSTTRNDCLIFLCQLFRDTQTIPAKDVYAKGVEEGYSKRTIDRVKKLMRIQSIKNGHGGWHWQLPQRKTVKSKANEDLANFLKKLEENFYKGESAKDADRPNKD
ncbi:hypothetical protein FACS189419_06900 [Planctomycetales bacterium]|nr:hypothetical protein FACS189419_06900 [Planctomycetales bacterium]